jgi:hypothetical protein
MTGSLKIPVLTIPPWKGTSLGKETFTETSFIDPPHGIGWKSSHDGHPVLLRF